MDSTPGPSPRVLFGTPIDPLRIGEVLERCRDAVERDETLAIGVVNAAKLVKMRDDALLRDSVVGSDLVLADGMSVVWASRLLGRPLPERVAGIDIFTELLGVAEETGRSVYLLGAAQEVLDRLVERIGELHPQLRIAGARNGYFDEPEEESVADAIRESGADYLFVGITSPKKEKFLARWGRDLGVHVCHGVGGSFDVVAGKVRRAPRLWQKLGLEWFYRLLQEPRRMWKRYLVTNTRFMMLCVKERFRRAPAHPAPGSGDDAGPERPAASGAAERSERSS